MSKKATKESLIINAAQSLFLKYGYSKTSLDDIAKEAHIGKGTIYYYFESKENLFFRIAENQIELIKEKLGETFKQTDIADWEEFFIKAVLKPMAVLLELDTVIFDMIHILKTSYTNKLEELEEVWLETIKNYIVRVIDVCVAANDFEVDAQELSIAILDILFYESEGQIHDIEYIKETIIRTNASAELILRYLYRGISK